jgi:NADH-quinone oxidoreductase subunit M
VILAAIEGQFLVSRSLAASTLVSARAYTLWMYKRVYFGAVANDHVEHLTDINVREVLVLGLLALAVLGMGIYPRSIRRRAARVGTRDPAAGGAWP